MGVNIGRDVSRPGRSPSISAAPRMASSSGSPVSLQRRPVGAATTAGPWAPSNPTSLHASANATSPRYRHNLISPVSLPSPLSQSDTSSASKARAAVSPQSASTVRGESRGGHFSSSKTPTSPLSGAAPGQPSPPYPSMQRPRLALIQVNGFGSTGAAYGSTLGGPMASSRHPNPAMPHGAIMYPQSHMYPSSHSFGPAHVHGGQQTGLLDGQQWPQNNNDRPLPPLPPAQQGHGPFRRSYPIWMDYWRPSYNMYFFLLAGVAFAMGHHVFYASLHGDLASDQLRMLRYGAALSFISKACLATSVILAFRQRVWLTVRRKVMSLGAVDSLFAAVDDLSAIVNPELFRHARVAILLAIYVWCTPLVVIFTSETLAVRLLLVEEEAECLAVRTLNFAAEETRDWRDAYRIDGLFPLSVSLWNTTQGAVDEDGETIEEWFDYFTASSWQFEQIATMAAFSTEPVARVGAAEEICGVGWNCTFAVNFTGPGYRCTELASGVGSTPQPLGNATLPFDFDLLAPTGNFTYIVRAFDGHYSSTQMQEVWPGGIPSEPGPIPKHLGALRTEPIMWIGYAQVDDPTKPQPEFRDHPDWDTAFTPKLLGCEHYETKYEVLFDYCGLQQTTKVTRREFVRPVVNTTFIPGVDADDGTADNTTAVPEENYILPTGDVHRYRRAMAYHSIGTQLRSFVNGTIEEPHKKANTRAIQTRLIEPRNWLPVPDLPQAMQSLYEDILLSMLSNPQMLAVTWAANPDGGPSGVGTGGDETKFPCSRSRSDTRYQYVAWELWAVYAAAIALAVLAVGFGTAAMWEEGLWRTTRFSSIVAATRGPWLEKVPWTRGGFVEAEAKKMKVGYGVVPAADGDTGQGQGQGEEFVDEAAERGDGLGKGRPRAGVQRQQSSIASPSGERYAFGLEGDVKLEKKGGGDGQAGNGRRTPQSPFGKGRR
ncbi:hypothetical protein SODALDRAFT_47877 [Sodiomyces alkalinus F11]|uniref:Formylmethionine deformylase-like protein n=1 Tax=Sodiomyces alkalinus (strain CBS 110278 / VKM F-3762 / F11) TaxID=1314773 RepID=A0A3N2QAK6_SODAK|nr:hypothetical protein SODALDRAFT_47877 [Sodiomyces alkalinus F11]ROT43789.1 hypothetical protein SODALDRAFT_47877 [Sodiomyces alkalinus F11]